MVYSPQFLSLNVSGGGLDGGGCGGICAEGIGGVSGASIGKGSINNRDFSRGYSGGATSSSSSAGAPTNEDRKMESIEQLVLNLNNLDLRENVLLELSKSRSYCYVFICIGTAITWRYTKQSIVATSSNHAEILAIHEASREYVWLRSKIHLIREKCDVKYDNLSTILYGDNASCITHLNGGLIKGDRTKHTSSKLFYIHELQKNGDISVQQIRSSENVADLSTKSSPITTFKKMVHKIGMQRFKDVLIRGS
ncbi:hypothetical protein P3S68_023095 [Capsicum galapagoense]